MKFLIGLVIVVGLSLGAYQIYEYWLKFQDKPETPAVQVTPQSVEMAGDQLPGMPPRLQPVLTAARQRGAPGLRDFIRQYGNAIADPRRASIELDYVVLLGESNVAEARRQFAKVKGRISSSSPVYPRLQELSKTYE